MESLENHLIDTENGIIKLLDPPFSKTKLEPGYIKSYLPGVRENRWAIHTCVLLLAPVFENIDTLKNTYITKKFHKRKKFVIGNKMKNVKQN